MTENLQIIQTKLVHLERMQANLRYSVSQVAKILPLQDWTLLTPDHHESLAAFRVRFSEFQEHIGKTMRAVAVEEEQDVERFGAVLAFMERLEVLTPWRTGRLSANCTMPSTTTTPMTAFAWPNSLTCSWQRCLCCSATSVDSRSFVQETTVFNPARYAPRLHNAAGIGGQTAYQKGLL